MEQRPSARLHVHCASQRGITLIEVLVAILVLSVGLLGLAGLQLKGMQVNQGSTYRWQAALLAEDLADRMRADITNAKSGAYSGNYTSAGAPATPAGAATQAAMDDWWARARALPGVSAVVVTAAPGANNSVTVGITLSWDDTRADAGTGVTANSSAAVLAASPAQASYPLTVEF